MGKSGRRLGFVGNRARRHRSRSMLVSAPGAYPKTVSKDTWAKGFCQAVEDWQTSVQKARTLVGDLVNSTTASSSSEVKATQKKIVVALTAATKASSSAAKEVKNIGAPDIDDGAAIAAKISFAIGSTAKVFSDARSAVEKAPTDPKQFQAKLKLISTKVDRDYAAAGEDLDDIDAIAQGGELDKALAAEPACSFVSNS